MIMSAGRKILAQYQYTRLNLPAIDTPRNAKAEAKVIAFDQFPTEVMSLNHSKVIDRHVSNFEGETNDKNNDDE